MTLTKPKPPYDRSLIPSSSYWAKLDRDPITGAVTSWHSVIGHCADVAASAYMLLHDTLLGERLATLLGEKSLCEAHMERLCVAVALHDAGKCNVGFQRRAARPFPSTGHVQPIVDMLDASLYPNLFDDMCDALDLERMVDWFAPDADVESQITQLLLATWGHHGRPVMPQSFEPRNWLHAADAPDPFQGIRDLLAATRLWFPRAASSDRPFHPSFPPAAQHAFNGLVTLADWIGSDSALFPHDQGSAERHPEAHYRASLEAARAHGARMHLIPTRARHDLLHRNVCLGLISEHTSPRPLQTACLELDLPSKGSVVVLESDTGSGKTEAAILHFLKLFQAGKVDSLYFALPTRTAATQLYERLREALAHAFSDEDHRPPVTLAVPGYLRVDDMTGIRASIFEVLWDDSSRSARAWAAESSKRFLSGAVVVGTIDQVLLSSVRANHAHMRATALMRSLLVIDEVHASDHYMTSLTHHVLRRHCAEAGGHAFLMSATLGTCALHDLLSACHVELEPLATVQETSTRHYPVLTPATPGAPLQPARPFAPTDHVKQIACTISPLMADEDLDTMLAAVITEARQGARVLILRNTVKGCVMTQQRLEQLLPGEWQDLLMCLSEKPVPVAHHSRFAQPDRQVLDRTIEQTIGKKSRRDGVIIVATQTVQQSLDLDADVMWTDLCPMDVLLQRVGRVHRHTSRKRPAKDFEAPQLRVLVPQERDLGQFLRKKGEAMGPHGIGTVYEDLRILEATWQELEAHATLTIPEMNRQLVERTTHPERLEQMATSHLGPHGAAHHQFILAQYFANESIASIALIRDDLPFDNDAICFPSRLEARATTRLGEEDRLVVFDPPVPSPLGSHTISQLRIPHHMCQRVTEKEPEVLVTSKGPTGFEFELGEVRYGYTRHGLFLLD